MSRLLERVATNSRRRETDLASSRAASKAWTEPPDASTLDCRQAAKDRPTTDPAVNPSTVVADLKSVPWIAFTSGREGERRRTHRQATSRYAPLPSPWTYLIPRPGALPSVSRPGEGSRRACRHMLKRSLTDLQAVARARCGCLPGPAPNQTCRTRTPPPWCRRRSPRPGGRREVPGDHRRGN